MIGKTIENILEKLELYYPEHKVFSLDSIDKDLRERISKYSKELGFTNTEEFFKRYGYEVIKGEAVKSLRNKVIYKPGTEPLFIKTKVESICRRLDEYYPNKIISRGIQNDHNALSKSISGMYQWLGYPDTKSFLESYGYTYNLLSDTGGRPASNDAEETLNYLIEKYSSNPVYTSLLDLKNNEPEYSGKLKTLANSAPKLYGMSLKEYLLEKNVLLKEVTREEVRKQQRKELAEQNKELLLNAIKETCESNNYNYELELAKYNDLKVEYREKSNTIVLLGILNKQEVINLPYGIDKIADSFYQDLDITTKLIVSETVQKLDFALLNNIKELILIKPKFRLKDEYFKTVKITIDNTENINNYLSIIDNTKKDEYVSLIEVIENSRRVACYYKKIEFFIDREFNLVFIGKDTIYYTNINMEEKIEIFDEILESLYELDWIKGLIDFSYKINKYNKVKINSNFEIIEGDINEN